MNIYGLPTLETTSSIYDLLALPHIVKVQILALVHNLILLIW